MTVIYDEPRSLGEIQPVIAKLLDQIWYNRHKNLAYEIEVGDVTLVDEYRPKDHQHTVVRSVWDGALAAARRVEERWPVSSAHGTTSSGACSTERCRR